MHRCLFTSCFFSPSLTPAKRHSPVKRRKTRSCKSPMKRVSKASSNLASPAKPSEEIVLISIPTTPIRCNTTNCNLVTSCTTTPQPQNTASPCRVVSEVTPTRTLRSPRTPSRKQHISPVKRSPGKVITLPKNVSPKAFSQKQGELCIVPFDPARSPATSQGSLSNLSANLLQDVNKQLGNFTSGTGSSDFLGFSPGAKERALPNFAKTPRRSQRNMKTVDEIAMWLQDKANFEARGESTVERVRRKRPLVEDSASTTPSKKRRLLS